jgi:glycosyltransferase involved in cell wall biosynthesis
MAQKILFISHKFYPDIGGIEVNSEILAGEFHKAGKEVHVLTWTKEPGDKLFPYQVIRNPNIKKIIEEHTWANVVYENNPCLRLSWPNLLINKVYVISLHSALQRVDGSIGIQDKLKLLWLARAHKVIAVSEAIRDDFWVEADVILNPYRTDLFKKKPAIKRVKEFAFLGRLVSKKGADIAIKSLRFLLNDISNRQDMLPTLTIIGDGPERKNLEKLVSSLDLTKNVMFTGTLQGDELVNCLNQHHFLLVPSLEEAFGNVVLEGMACGCLPIVSDVGGLPKAVGKAGITFKSENVNELTACMARVLHEKELVEKLQNEVPIHLKKHQPAAVANKYLEVIESAYKI